MHDIRVVFILTILYLIGNIIGSFASGWISATYGRKSTLLWSGFPMALSWMAMGLSTDYTMVYVTSFTHGLFASVPWTSAGAYVSETTERHLRKVLGLCKNLENSIGFFITYLLGYLIGWRLTCFVMVAITGFSIFLILPLPETPYWLIEKDRHEEAL